MLAGPAPALARGGPRRPRRRSGARSSRARGSRAAAPGIKVRTGLIRTRSPGAALVDEARRIGADVIYLSTLHAPASEQRIGPTASYLLDKRPCRIVIETARERAVARARLTPLERPRSAQHRSAAGEPGDSAARPSADGPGRAGPAASWMAKWMQCGRKVRICVAKWGRTWYGARSEPGWRGSSRLFQPGSTFFHGAPAMAFRGYFDNTLDAKNRLTIPAKLRKPLADGVVVALQRDAEQCIAIWCAGRLRRLRRRACSRASTRSPRTTASIERFFNAYSAELELDAAGRVMLPAQAARGGRPRHARSP